MHIAPNYFMLALSSNLRLFVLTPSNQTFPSKFHLPRGLPSFKSSLRNADRLSLAQLNLLFIGRMWTWAMMRKVYAG